MQKTLYIQIDTNNFNEVECPKLVKRGDTLKLQIKVFTNGVLADLTGQAIDLILVKSDGKPIQKAITNVANGIITAVLDIQATNVSGIVSGEAQISDINGQSSTNTFTFVVDNSLANDVVAASEYDIQVLNDMRALMAEYQEEILNFGEATLATEALANIKAYIDANLQSLITKNDEALVNITNLSLTTVNANAKKIELEDMVASSETSANNIVNELNTAKVSANIDKDLLIATIANADDKLQEFKDYDTTELVPLSNTMLDKMYCTEELLTINHNLNCYPIVQLVYTEFGFGVGGYNDNPMGANSRCNLMQSETIYTDRNNFILYVPSDYYIANPTVVKVNDYKYVVTFLNSTKSIVIQLKEMI